MIFKVEYQLLTDCVFACAHMHVAPTFADPTFCPYCQVFEMLMDWTKGQDTRACWGCSENRQFQLSVLQMYKSVTGTE